MGWMMMRRGGGKGAVGGENDEKGVTHRQGRRRKLYPPPPPGIDGSVIQFRAGDTVSVQGERGCSDYGEHTELTFAVFTGVISPCTSWVCSSLSSSNGAGTNKAMVNLVEAR